MKKLPYKEGTWFAIPLEQGGYGVGRVARYKGPGILPYFFGPKREIVPTLEEVAHLKPNGAIAIAQVGYLSLVGGRWPIIGDSPNWDRTKWLIPIFIRKSEIGKWKHAWLVKYSDDDIDDSMTKPVPFETSGYEKDSCWGDGAAEFAVSQMLAYSYDPKKGFIFSEDFIKSQGWSNQSITNKQKELFKALAESGTPSSLAEHERIAKETLVAGGAPGNVAKTFVERAVGNLAVREKRRTGKEEYVSADSGERRAPSKPEPVLNEQAVIVCFKYGQNSTKPLEKLEDRLTEAIDAANVGEFDGNEIAVDLSEGSLYMYGPNAEKLFAVVRPILESTKFLRGATVTLRFGPAEDDVPERAIKL